MMKNKSEDQLLPTCSNKPKPVVLITGGAGFIGSHTADALVRAGYCVRIFDCLDPQIHGEDRAFPSYLHSEIECIQGDVRNADELRRALRDVSFVYHFAALTGVGQSMYDIANYVDVNCTGTANLLEIVAKDKLPVRRIVLSSSRAVYGEGTHHCPNCGVVYPPIRNRNDMEGDRFEVFCPICATPTRSVLTSEQRPLIPISVYGWTKKSQEDLCQIAAHTYQLPTVSLRYFNVYGSRQSLINPYTGIVSIFFSRLKQGKAISIYEHGSPLRDFVHVSDIVQANVSALIQDLSPGATLNVGSGTEVTVFDVANSLARALGVTPLFEDFGEFRVGDIHACVADLSQTLDKLNYKPTVSLEEGMREFASWANDKRSIDQYQKTVDELKAFGLFGRSQLSDKP